MSTMGTVAGASAVGAASRAARSERFYLSSRHRVLAALVASCETPRTAEDVAQEAYLRAWTRWDHVQTLADPEARVLLVAWRLSRDLRRRALTAIRLGSRTATPTTAHLGERDTALLEAVRQLPPAQRVVVALYYLLDIPVEGVAEHLGIPTGTVKARLARARTTLSGLLN